MNDTCQSFPVCRRIHFRIAHVSGLLLSRDTVIREPVGWQLLIVTAPPPALVLHSSHTPHTLLPHSSPNEMMCGCACASQHICVYIYIYIYYGTCINIRLILIGVGGFSCYNSTRSLTLFTLQSTICL